MQGTYDVARSTLDPERACAIQTWDELVAEAATKNCDVKFLRSSSLASKLCAHCAGGEGLVRTPSRLSVAITRTVIATGATTSSSEGEVSEFAHDQYRVGGRLQSLDDPSVFVAAHPPPRTHIRTHTHTHTLLQLLITHPLIITTLDLW